MRSISFGTSDNQEMTGWIPAAIEAYLFHRLVYKKIAAKL
jgi:hypothetical protein